jgi:hypothetical protein
MGRELAYGAAISIIFAFARWAVPAMPKPVAWSGVVAGIAILIATWAIPQMNISLPVIALFLFGAICVGGAAYLAMKPKTIEQAPVAAAPRNTMGNVDGNTGIITQGQQGNNTMERK